MLNLNRYHIDTMLSALNKRASQAKNETFEFLSDELASKNLNIYEEIARIIEILSKIKPAQFNASFNDLDLLIIDEALAHTANESEPWLRKGFESTRCYIYQRDNIEEPVIPAVKIVAGRYIQKRIDRLQARLPADDIMRVTGFDGSDFTVNPDGTVYDCNDMAFITTNHKYSLPALTDIIAKAIIAKSA